MVTHKGAPAPQTGKKSPTGLYVLVLIGGTGRMSTVPTRTYANAQGPTFVWGHPSFNATPERPIASGPQYACPATKAAPARSKPPAAADSHPISTAMTRAYRTARPVISHK